jgi:hypothetical protein
VPIGGLTIGAAAALWRSLRGCAAVDLGIAEVDL